MIAFVSTLHTWSFSKESDADYEKLEGIKIAIPNSDT